MSISLRTTPESYHKGLLLLFAASLESSWSSFTGRLEIDTGWWTLLCFGQLRLTAPWMPSSALSLAAYHRIFWNTATIHLHGVQSHNHHLRDREPMGDKWTRALRENPWAQPWLYHLLNLSESPFPCSYEGITCWEPQGFALRIKFDLLCISYGIKCSSSHSYQSYSDRSIYVNSILCFYKP